MSGYVTKTLYGSSPQLKPYESLIFSTYLKSLRFGCDWFKDIDADAYFKTYHRVLEAYLSRPKVLVSLALMEDDSDLCVGWSLWEANRDKMVLHYVFVKENKGASLRKQGIAKALVPQDVTDFTHLTRVGRSIWKKNNPAAKFNPFL